MASSYVFVLFLSYELALVRTASRDRNREAYQCLVCQYTIDEINEEIKKVDPRKTLEVGGYCSNLENEEKKIPYARSEVGLVEIFERVCGAFENYCRAKYKDTGSPTILKYFTSERDSLNPEMAKVDVVTDSDLNESLRYYCEQIIEEHQDELLRYFGRDDPDIKEKICMQKKNDGVHDGGQEAKRKVENKMDRYNKDEFKEEKSSMESYCGRRMVERPSKVAKYQ
ncbi:protein canopy homolog 2-like [Schistocerca serialis cubense]|uniref:protein canopy homolog 2-like n=1 Tax=Schistocerca serialis cubense TaxID=2023355 RepID=UPI00214F4AC6|nr:protein canopy homolog 2-like [Schistocerca serialis cubense]